MQKTRRHKMLKVIGLIFGILLALGVGLYFYVTSHRGMRSRTQKLVLGIVKILGIIVCILIAITLIVVSALLYYENHDFSGQNGLDKKEFSCCRGDLEIRGTMFMPSGQTDVPIAIVCHEFMTNRLFSYPYAMALARNGYAAFCFDFCGGGIVCGSDGDSRDMSVLTEIEDLKSVIAFAKEQRYTNDHPLRGQGADPPRKPGYPCEYFRFPKGSRSLRSCRGGCTFSDHPRRQAYFSQPKTHKNSGKYHIGIRRANQRKGMRL